MEPKTKQQIVNEAKAYLEKTSRHLFVTGTQGSLYKIIPLEVDGELYFTTIIFRKDSVFISVRKAISDNDFKYHGNNGLNVLKKCIFPDYYKTKSIPNFKKMKTLVGDIMSEISIDDKTNLVLADKIKTRLVELEPTK